MVKNVNGGKHKNQARKNLTAPVSSRIRLPEDEMECFAKVTAMSGNGMCRVDVAHKDQLLSDVCCHIRGKFRGKNKSRNMVVRDAYVLVGLRGWTSATNECDLLEVYQSTVFSSLPIPACISSVSEAHEEALFLDNPIVPQRVPGETVHLGQAADIDFDII
jgi:translation initiation factor IF-1